MNLRLQILRQRSARSHVTSANVDSYKCKRRFILYKCKRRFILVQTQIQAYDMANVWHMRHDSCVMWRIHHMKHDVCVTYEHVMHATCAARRTCALLRVFRAFWHVYRALLRVCRALFICDMTRVWHVNMWCARNVWSWAQICALACIQGFSACT